MKLKAEIKQYKVHLDNLRRDKEEDVAGSEMAKYFGDNVASAAAKKARKSIKRKAAEEAARVGAGAAGAGEQTSGEAAAGDSTEATSDAGGNKKAKPADGREEN